MSVIFSDDRRHRFILQRGDVTKPYVLFLGLNPSTADEDAEDATTRRLNGFTQSWGFAHWQIGNLSAYVATDPKKLRNRPQDEAVLAAEDWHLTAAIAGATLIVPCWGAGVVHLGEVSKTERPRQVLQLCEGHWHKLRCFGRTEGGYPKHPLYLNSDTQLDCWCDLA